MSTLGDMYKEFLHTPSLNAYDIRELLLLETSFSTHDELLLHLDSPWRPSSSFDDRFARLVKGEPVAYIVQSSMFYHQRFYVTPDVLIPRPETEELVKLVFQKTEHMKKSLHVVDIGTGSGVIACTIKRLRPHWSIGASDIDAKALDVARHNAKHVKGPIDFRLGSGIEPWRNESVEGIISNPPYILDKNTIDDSVWAYEPHHALLCNQESSLFGPLLRCFNEMPSLQFIAFELFEGWKQWMESFIQEHRLDVTIEWIYDINQKVRFAWIERKRIK